LPSAVFMTEGSKNNPGEELAILERSPQAVASWQFGQQCLRHRRYAPALASFKKLVQQFPGVAHLWVELGRAAAGELDFTLAGQAFDRATALAATDLRILMFVSQQYCDVLRRMDESVDCLKRAVAADPSSVEASCSLALRLERNRRMDEAFQSVNDCLARRPSEGMLRFVKAYLLHAKGLDSEAESVLRDLLKNDSWLRQDKLGSAHHLLGGVLDSLGQYAEAFRSIATAKAMRYKLVNPAPLIQSNEKVCQVRREFLAALTPEILRHWRDDAAHSTLPHPLAALAGLPRSGTTLLEQILAAHPEIRVVDELDAFKAEILDGLPPVNTREISFKTISRLTPAERAKFTGRYFKSLLREADDKPGAKLLLDKNPTTTAWLHVWFRFFPAAKVVIPLRDPRDTILSCFFQDFVEAGSVVSFRTLESTAQAYVEYMKVWLRLRELGGFDWIETRYENLVNNVEAEGRRVTEFLGLQWHPDQSKPHETARQKFIYSPNYQTVAQPVHNRAVGRWKHYAEAIEPLQASLKPYLQPLGYD
jgi:tetratricopeptide (TPR) repeat protein